MESVGFGLNLHFKIAGCGTRAQSIPAFLSRGTTCLMQSDRADGEIDDVVDGHGLFLEKRFAVFYADELAVMPGEEFHAVVEFIDGEEDALLALALGGAELRAVGKDGSMTGRVLFRDVDDEGGRHTFEGRGVENFEGTIGFAVEGKLLEACEKAAFVAKRGGVVVIGMARFPIGENHGPGAELSNDLRQAEFILPRWLDVRIRNTEISAPGNFQDSGSECGFFGACFRSTTRAHFTGGEIEDAGFVAALGHFQKGAAAGEFDVVGVGSDGEDVEVHVASGDQDGAEQKFGPYNGKFKSGRRKGALRRKT